jgi:hypothetical protein
MKRLYLLGLAAAVALMPVDQIPAFAKGGHGHGGHRSHGQGGHGHRGHAHGGHAHKAAHSGHARSRRNHALAHRHSGVHNRNFAGHHAAWSHHYANHRHSWGNHHAWGYNHGRGYHHGWGWGGGGWNWYGGGVNVVGPSVVNPGYVGPSGPNVVVVPGSNVNAPGGPLGGQGFFSVLGTISAIKGNTVSVAPEEGDPVTIDTTRDTTIVLNSQQSSLADLQPSDRVKARYDKDLNAMTVVAVRH